MQWVWDSQSAIPSKFNQVKPKANLSSIISCEMFWPLFVNSAERSGSKFGWFLTLVILAVVTGAGIAGYIFYKYRLRVCLHAFNIWTSFFLSILGYWFVSLLARNDVIIQHFLFPIAVLHGLRDHGYHVAIHATWQQPEQWSFNRSPATTAWRNGVR